ncbi:hypothetical protein QBC44DRAFT_402296 [Cladorrhinum sp. PSN332]|nr:hypothetical protein QBC44DRAFT_402296 [Cladorrhinum sp. PSN332]
MSAPCPIAGNPDMYGLGIRVSFYLIWISTLCLNPIEERYIAILFVGELVLDAAVFLGLVIAASGGYLHAVEVYITILLLSTTVYLIFPRHLADLAMAICPHLGLRIKKRIHQNYVAAVRCLYAIVIVALQLWFWISGVDDSHIHRMLTDTNEVGCQQIGFLFGPVDLHNSALKAVHIIVLLLAVAAGILTELKFYQNRIHDQRRWKFRSRWTKQKWVETMGGLAVATTLITAIELTIKWNRIPGVVNQATTAAQLIPLLLVVALIVTFLYAYVRASSTGDDSSSDSDNEITLSVASGPSGGGSASSSSGSSPEPPVVIVRQGRPRSRTQSEPEIIRVSYPSPTHRSSHSRRTRPRGPRPLPERYRRSSPQAPPPTPEGGPGQGPRIIDVHPPRRSYPSSSSSSSSGSSLTVNVCRYPPHYPFPHIFRRQPTQSSSKALTQRAAPAATTATTALPGAPRWRHTEIADDPDQREWVRHPAAVSTVEASSPALAAIAYLEPPEAASAEPAPPAVSTATPEPTADRKEAEPTCDRQETQPDLKMKEENHHKIWEEVTNAEPLLNEKDVEDIMTGSPDLLTDDDINGCMEPKSVLSDAEVAAYMAASEFYTDEDIAAKVRGESHYTEADVNACQEGRVTGDDVEDLMNPKEYYTDEDVAKAIKPRIPQPTMEEEGESSRMAEARKMAPQAGLSDSSSESGSGDEGGDEPEENK